MKVSTDQARLDALPVRQIVYWLIAQGWTIRKVDEKERQQQWGFINDTRRLLWIPTEDNETEGKERELWLDSVFQLVAALSNKSEIELLVELSPYFRTYLQELLRKGYY